MSRAKTLFAALLACLAAAPASAQPAAPRRSVPAELRERLVGCWALDHGETYVIEPDGAHGLRGRWRVRHGDPGSGAGTLYYLPDAHSVSGGCGRRSHHGHICVFSSTGDGLSVTQVSGYSGRETPRTVQRCATGAAVPDVPAPAVRPVPAGAPIAELLVRHRRDIDATRTPTGDADGWTRYGDDLAIQFDHGVAMRVRARLPGPSCEEAAVQAGFPPSAGTAPLRRATGCEWPGVSERHRLAPQVAARWTSADGVFEIWRTE